MESRDLGPLADLCLQSRAGVCINNTGMDSLQFCRDRAHYRACRSDISYQFNSRGFRDHEWLGDLSTAIWCLGDSFTVGIGQPFAEIWPQQLTQTLDQRTINVSMDGASNAWIARRAQQILTEIQPRIMILHWSFLHRREDSDTHSSDEDRRIWHVRDSDDIVEFQRCIDQVEKARGNSLLLHSTIPGFSPNLVVRQVMLRRCVGRRAMPDLEFADHGRDGYHYGPRSTGRLVNYLASSINMFDVDTILVT